jgi:hypothetical protein
MSDERLQQLGIPRRKFLKSTAAAAFVAPVVVSFGLDGIAEAHPHSFPNQTFGNQTFPNQFCPNQAFANQSFAAEQDLVQLIGQIVSGVQSGALGFGEANSLAERALHAALQLAAGRVDGACAELDEIVRRIEASPATLGSLLPLAVSAQMQAGCGCSATDNGRRHHHHHHDR